MNINNIPAELKNLKQWVLWKSEQKPGAKKPTKIPYQTNGKRADTMNPETWGEFDEVFEKYQEPSIKYQEDTPPNPLLLERELQTSNIEHRTSFEYSGIGFVFSANDEYCGLDFDDYIDDAGVVSETVINWIERFDSYTEISQSGKGIHIIIKGLIPGTKRRKGKFEVYESGRYFAFTGELYDTNYYVIQERQGVLDGFYYDVIEKYQVSSIKYQEKTHPLIPSQEGKQSPLPKSDCNQSTNRHLTDNEIIEKLTVAKNSQKFLRLWGGDFSDYASQSEADLGLTMMLAFYTQDESQIDRLFQMSDLKRDKWNRKDYKQRTITSALRKITETYKGNGNRETGLGKNTPPNPLLIDGESKQVGTDGSLNVPSKLPPKKEFKGVDVIQKYLNDTFIIHYNRITNRIEYQKKDSDDLTWYEVNDRFVNEVWRYFQMNGYNYSAIKIRQILDSEFIPEYDPFREYFYSLPEWDGDNHIGFFISLIETPPEQTENWTKYFRKWIVGAVACALERGLNHHCIVLVGKGGIGKTTVIKKLIPDILQNYLMTGQINPYDKDSRIAVAESFIINLDELESINREEIGLLKSLMTIEMVSIRRPYGHYKENLPRHASFIGSLNRAQFLTDLTGNRRFLVIDAISINNEKTVNINQLYAQALYMLNNGFEYWFSGDDIEKINEANQKFETVSPEEEVINRIYDAPDLTKIDNDHFENLIKNSVLQYKTITEIYEECLKNTTIRLTIHKLGMVLKRLGFEQTIRKVNKKTTRVYIVKKADLNIDIYDDSENNSESF